MKTNRCDSCGTTNLDADSGLCGGCGDDLWDAARYYDIGDDE